MNNHELAFNRRWELNFRFISNCLLVADADCDGNLEVSVGSRDGVLCVYKFDYPEPWKSTMPVATASGSMGGPFGLITALAVGDLFNTKKPVLVSISADGACYACRLGGVGNIGQPGVADDVIQPCFKQLLPSNIKGAYIGDIDGDGRSELIVALTDRVVRTYRFLTCATPFHASSNPSGQQATGLNNRVATTPNATSGMGFCCGYLVALNKWESPAQVTAFSVCPSNVSPDSGVTVLLSQPGDKYLLLKPKLCLENDPADNLSDISVVYCETSRATSVSKSGTVSTAEKSLFAEHRRGHKSASSSKNIGTKEKRKRRLFVSSNATRIDLFHNISRYITVVDHNHEHRIVFPTPVFSITPLKVLSSSVSESPVEKKKYKELLLACDWTNNVYACSIDGGSGMNANGEDSKDEKLHRLKSMVTMKTYGPVMCFAAGYSESVAPDELFVAISTCEEKLFIYSVRVSKILRNLANE